MIEQYQHHGALVCVESKLKGKHREHCLCYKCDKFQPKSWNENCPRANILFNLCVILDMVTPVWECSVFQPKEGVPMK